MTNKMIEFTVEKWLESEDHKAMLSGRIEESRSVLPDQPVVIVWDNGDESTYGSIEHLPIAHMNLQIPVLVETRYALMPESIEDFIVYTSALIEAPNHVPVECTFEDGMLKSIKTIL